MQYEHECQCCHHKWTDTKPIERCPKCGVSIDATGIPDEVRELAHKQD